MVHSISYSSEYGVFGVYEYYEDYHDRPAYRFSSKNGTRYLFYIGTYNLFKGYIISDKDVDGMHTKAFIWHPLLPIISERPTCICPYDAKKDAWKYAHRLLDPSHLLDLIPDAPKEDRWHNDTKLEVRCIESSRIGKRF